MAEEDLKKTFLKTYAENIQKELYYEKDIARVKSGDTVFLKTYLTHYKGVLADAVTGLDTSLQWRKSFGVEELSDESFPDSLLQENVIFFSNTDLAGDSILHVQCVKMKKDVAYTETAKKLIVYRIEKNFQLRLGQRVVVLYDMSTTGLNNVDTNFIKFVISCFANYYPATLSYLVLVEMPWILSAVWTVVKNWLTAEQKKYVRVVKKAELTKMISSDNLFTHLGGNCTENKDPFEGVLPQATPVKIPEKIQEQETTKKTSISQHVTSESNTDSFQLLPETSLPTAIPNYNEKEETKTSELSTEMVVMSGEKLSHEQRSLMKRLNVAFVCVSPLDYIDFNPNSHSSSTIFLINNSAASVIFKIKTTTPDLFKVTPHTGILSPSNCLRVSCTAILVPGEIIELQKILVSLILLNNEPKFSNTPQSINQNWSSLHRNNINSIDYKIRCRAELLYVPTSIPEQPALIMSDNLKKWLSVIIALSSFPLITFVCSSLQQLFLNFFN